MKHYLYILLLWVSVLTATLTGNAADRLKLKHLETGTGLSNNRINAILKDDDGFLWIATTSGLCRYDGYDIKLYISDPDSPGGTGNNNIGEIHRAPDGRLWILAGKDYIIYDPAIETFTRNITGIMKEMGIDGTPSKVLFDSNGAMWFYVTGLGIYRLNPGEEKAAGVEGLIHSTHEITDMAEGNGTIIGVDNTGIMSVIDPKSLKIIKQITHIADTETSGYNYVYTVDIDRDGNVWVFNTEQLWLYDPIQDRWLTDKLPGNGRNMVVKTMYQGRNGEIWIGRDHHGLERVVKDPDGIKFEQVWGESEGTHGSNNTVTTLFEDNGGTMWVGTYKRGLFYHNESAEKFSLETLPDVNCILNDRTGPEMWVGTDNSGLLRWNPLTGVSTSVPDPSEGNTPAAITSMTIGNDNALYIGTFSRGLKKLENGVFTRIVTGTNLDTTYPWALVGGDKNDLWIGTLGGGIYNYNLASGETESYNMSNCGLKGDFITSAIRSKDGRFYFATSSGIVYYDPTSDRIETLVVNADEKDDAIVNSGNINQIYEDSRGLMWIATPNGLKVYDRPRKQLHDIPLRDNLKYLYILGIIEDSNNGMWVSEGGNLINIEVDYNEKNGRLSTVNHVYDSRDGIQNSDFNQRSFAMLDNGDIVAGGLYGINRFSPASIKYNKVLPRVMFTGLSISNKEVTVGEEINGVVPLTQSLNHGHELQLPPSAGDFTINFATDNYVLPDKTTYYYKLEGYNNEWITCPARVHHVTYTNLSPGHYRLLVKAVNSDGYESAAPAELSITVRPPFYATPLAYILYILLGAGAIYGIVKLVRNRERRRFNERRHEDAMRKQEEINQLKFKFFTNISHELRTPLTLIVSPLEAMLKESQHDEKQTRRLSMMRNNAMRLLNLVNQLLDFRKNEVAGLQLSASEGDIIAFLRNACNSFTTMSERKNINLTFYSPDESVNMMFDEDKMGKIIMNLLSNAFKFTPAGGRVDVAVERVHGTPGAVRVKVADTGIGIKDKDKERIFERFYQVDDNGDAHPGMGSGIGLSLVSEYVKLHNGSIRVTDNPGGGSVFIIELPMGSKTAENVAPASETAVENEPETKPIPALIDEKPAETPNSDPAPAPATAPKTAPEPAKAPAPAAAIPAGKRPTALVVDDSADMVEFIKDGLTPEFHVITAPNGAEALKLLESLKPAIILTDLMMPEMDGIELCRRLKANSETASIPVIILTAKHDMQAKVEGLTIGADDYITKPFNIDLLLLRMRRLVELTAKGVSRTTIDPEPGEIKITPLDERLIEKAVKYVVANIKRPELSVEELSSHLGMSRVHLYKKMKAITGKTPIEFIRLIRLKRAAQMLRESQMNVSEIAYQLGFNSPKYFSKYFKDEFGVLPSVYQSNESKGTNYTV